MKGKLVLTPLLLALILAAALPRLVEAAPPVLHISPVNNTAEPDSTFSIDLTVSGVVAVEDGKKRSLYGWEVQIKFDPAIIKAVSASEGPFLKAVKDTVALTPEINNVTGTVRFGASFMPPYPETGAVGDGTLASMVFKAVGRGTTSLHFDYTEMFTIISNNVVGFENTSEDGSFSNGSSGITLPLELIAAVVIVAAVGTGGAFLFWRRRRSSEE